MSGPSRFIDAAPAGLRFVKPVAAESRFCEGAPGPAPRPGLVWNDATHRWRNPATGEEHEHPAATKPPAAKKDKAGAAPKAVAVVKSADGSRTTTFAAGVPEAAAAKLAPAILDAMKELKFDIDFQDGIIPLGALAQEVKNTTPDATDGEILAALSHMRQTRQIEGQPLNEVQKLEDPKSDAYPLGGGKNLDAATLWDKGKPIHYFLLPRGKAESIFADPIHGDTLRAIVEAAVARVLEDMGPPPFAGAVFDKAKHRWVKPADATGAKSDTTTGSAPAELHPDDKASIAAGIDKDVAALPEGQRPPASLVEKAKQVAFGIAAKAYIWAMHATHSRAAGVIAGALGEIFDTPQDMAKLGYNPNTSSGTANPRTADAVSGALNDTIGVGVSGHLVASIASKVLVKAGYWVAAKLKGKPAAEAMEDDGYAVWAGFIAQLLAKTAKQMGDAGPTPDTATVEAKLRELLKGKV